MSDAEAKAIFDAINRVRRDRTESDGPAAILGEWRKAEQGATDGPWRLVTDSCDCNDGMCSHGSFPYAIVTLAALDEVLKLADGARATLSFPPADCTNACSDGPCNCSGKSRAAGWELDPEAVREAISKALLGEESDRA